MLSGGFSTLVNKIFFTLFLNTHICGRRGFNWNVRGSLSYTWHIYTMIQVLIFFQEKRISKQDFIPGVPAFIADGN